MPDARVAVVVVNWNNADDTLKCLAALREHDPGIEVVVVDNGSDNGSAEAIARSGLAPTLLCSSRNEGFTGGANRGIAHALTGAAEFVAVLNSDAAVTGPALTCLARTAAAHVGPVAVSPLIVWADDSEVPWFGGGVIERGMPRHLQPVELAGRPAGVHRSQWLTGCCVLAHRAVWKRVGLFDERYFLFFEDGDWSARARRAGVELVVDSTVVIRHGVSRSFRGPAALLGTYYYARNGVTYRRRTGAGHTWRFLRDEVVIPPVRGWVGRGPRLPAWPFGWFGAVCGLLGIGGPAPVWLTRLAARRERRPPPAGAGEPLQSS